MTRFAFDLYPRANPGAGTRLVRFTQLQSAEYRKDANGTGAGKLSIRANSTDAAFIDPDGLQYVRVVLIKNDASEVVYGGFFLETGDFAALTETSTKLLNFGGAGPLSVLQRGEAAHQSYIGADGPVDGEWRWSTQTVGEIVDRMVREAQAGARPQAPLPMVTSDFDGDVDSASNPWPVTDVDFRFSVGRDLLELVRQAMSLGLFVDMDGDFGLHAWVTRGTDRTGGAWGAGVVRFQAPSAGTVATGNIKSEARRGLTAKVQRSHMLVGSPEVGYDWVAGSPTLGLQDIVWEGFFPTDSQMAGLAGPAIAEAQMAARDAAGDTVRLRTVFGESPSTGAYAPGLHYDVADPVTLHTGTGTWDWNETTQVVSNVTLKLRDGGDWDVWVDLGSSFQSMESRQFSMGVPAPQADPHLHWLPHRRYDDFNRTPSSPVAIGATPSPLIGAARSGRAWMVSATAAATVEMDGNKAVFVIGASPAVVRAYVQDPNGVWLSDKRDPPNPYLCHFYLLTRFSIAAVSTATRQVRFWVGDGEISTGADIDTNSGTVFVQDPTNGVSKAKKDWAATTYDLLWEKVPFGYSRAKLWRINGPVFPPEEWTVASENLPPTGEGALNDTQLGFSYDGLAGDNFTVEFIDIIHGSYAPGLAVDVGSFTAVSKWGLD